jgi:hypothetical protein
MESVNEFLSKIDGEERVETVKQALRFSILKAGMYQPLIPV